MAFFAGVRQFYQEVVRKMVAKFPFGDATIQDLSVLDPRNRLSISSASVSRLASRFASISANEEMDELLAEVRDYKSMSESLLPTLDTSSATGVDHFWAEMAAMKQPGDQQQQRFPRLAVLAKALLVLPHSTADPERLFSMIKKIETDHRGSLLPSTVRSLLSVKLNTDEDCYHSKDLFTPKLLKAAKSATERSVTCHS